MTKAIYKITNKINGKIYIGQSIHPEQRFLQHCHKQKNYKSLINDAIKKYGKNNFDFEILGWFDDYNEKEKYYINFYSSLAPYGYNILEGGEDPPVGANSKITKEIAEQIQQDCLNLKMSRKQIIKKYKITNDIMRYIIDGTSWKNNELVYPLRPKESELNHIKALKVIQLLKETNLSQKEIGKIVGWNRSAVTMINIGKNHHQDDLEYPIRK